VGVDTASELDARNFRYAFEYLLGTAVASVLVVVGGGWEDREVVLHAVRENRVILLLKGSGRLADFLYFRWAKSHPSLVKKLDRERRIRNSIYSRTRGPPPTAAPSSASMLPNSVDPMGTPASTPMSRASERSNAATEREGRVRYIGGREYADKTVGRGCLTEAEWDAARFEAEADEPFIFGEDDAQINEIVDEGDLIIFDLFNDQPDYAVELLERCARLFVLFFCSVMAV
jgi:hypothetical protein